MEEILVVLSGFLPDKQHAKDIETLVSGKMLMDDFVADARHRMSTDFINLSVKDGNDFLIIATDAELQQVETAIQYVRNNRVTNLDFAIVVNGNVRYTTYLNDETRQYAFGLPISFCKKNAREAQQDLVKIKMNNLSLPQKKMILDQAHLILAEPSWAQKIFDSNCQALNIESPGLELVSKASIDAIICYIMTWLTFAPNMTVESIQRPAIYSFD